MAEKLRLCWSSGVSQSRRAYRHLQHGNVEDTLVSLQRSTRALQFAAMCEHRGATGFRTAAKFIELFDVLTTVAFGLVNGASYFNTSSIRFVNGSARCFQNLGVSGGRDVD
jgi:hypothetical protein